MVVVIFCYLCCFFSNMLKWVLSCWVCCNCSSCWKCNFQQSVGLSIWTSQLKGNPAFFSEASSTHKFTGHARGPEKSVLYRLVTFLLASKGLRLNCQDGEMLHQDNCPMMSDHHWQKGLLYPPCSNQIMVLLDWGCGTTLLLGLKRKTDLKGRKALLYKFWCLISN